MYEAARKQLLDWLSSGLAVEVLDTSVASISYISFFTTITADALRRLIWLPRVQLRGFSWHLLFAKRSERMAERAKLIDLVRQVHALFYGMKLPAPVDVSSIGTSSFLGNTITHSVQTMKDAQRPILLFPPVDSRILRYRVRVLF